MIIFSNLSWAYHVCLCLFASGAAYSVCSERVTEVSTSAVIAIPFAKMGAHHSNCLQPVDMVFDHMLVKQYSEIMVQFRSLLKE